jgi:hypothetical protein
MSNLAHTIPHYAFAKTEADQSSQWGNLLVLSAAFKDPVLHQFVDEKLLRNLCDKTIRLLRQSATETSSLRTDMRILEGLQRDLFPDL